MWLPDINSLIYVPLISWEEKSLERFYIQHFKVSQIIRVVSLFLFQYFNARVLLIVDCFFLVIFRPQTLIVSQLIK